MFVIHNWTAIVKCKQINTLGKHLFSFPLEHDSCAYKFQVLFAYYTSVCLRAVLTLRESILTTCFAFGR